MLDQIVKKMKTMGAEQILQGAKSTPTNKQSSAVDPVAIIKQSAQEAGMDPKQAMNIAASNVKQGSKIIPSGKTLMFFRKIDDTSVSAFFVSIDKGAALQKALDKLAAVLEKSSAEVVYTSSKNKNIINEFANIGIVFTKSNDPKFTYMAKLK
jgi:hypothetical protein